MRKAILSILTVIASISYGQTPSIEELRDSMAAGNLNYQVDLAIKYLQGDEVPQDSQEAYRLIKDAADKGNRYGLLWQGVCFQEGIAVEKDLDQAFHCFLKSAEKGNLPAKNLLGQAYEFGRGTEPNIEEAVRYYQEAANEGYSPSFINLAVCYEHGRGVEQDWGKSFELMKRAADNGEEGALFLLARYYFNGWGTEKDNEEALRILKMFKDGEFGEEAKSYINSIENGDSLKSYEFQFQFIPSLLWAYKNGDQRYVDLLNISDWERNFRSIFISYFEWDWQQLSTSIHVVSNSSHIILYHMPQPQRVPLCLFSAAFIDKEHQKYRYFTLEKSINLFDEKDTPWVVGEVDQDMSHLNYGYIKGEANEENFLNRIMELIK